VVGFVAIISAVGIIHAVLRRMIKPKAPTAPQKAVQTKKAR
jgi:hypothetical protein